MGQDGEDRKGGGADVTSNSQQPQPSGERAAYPGAPPSAPSFDDEIEHAVEYERGLALKALLSIALVALVLALRVAFFG
jgi:hypothetical protein